MYGIAGVLLNESTGENEYVKEHLNLCKDMSRRGPDNQFAGFQKIKVGLGHNELSIIDLNERSNQPMSIDNNNYVISFNGEIYNYKELKSYLKKYKIEFTTQSDTEVILKLYKLKGPKMLNMLRGMFSIAIWDEIREVFLAEIHTE